ncbi:hypothetical protein DH86_00001296 [Scytalidium sp. 3C]|nr:hypothetical protein DH86_00001296 [Scytalidium sp. 3C]
MLIGPRVRDGNDGYLVVTPLEREGDGTTVLVNRGWIPKKFKKQADRPDSTPQGELTVEGLLREPLKKNWFTPENKPETKEFYFPDVFQMARLTNSQPVWIEETMVLRPACFAYASKSSLTCSKNQSEACTMAANVSLLILALLFPPTRANVVANLFTTPAGSDGY